MPNRAKQYRPQATTANVIRPKQRGTAAQRGYSSPWQRAAKAFIIAHPLCKACADNDRVASATCVDHITPHRGDKGLFWNRDNWQPLCKPCHDRKTASGR